MGLIAPLQPVVGSGRLVGASASLIPVTAPDVAAAVAGPTSPIRSVTTTGRLRVRVLTVPLVDGYALMIYRDLSETDNTPRPWPWSAQVAWARSVRYGRILLACNGLRPVDQLTRAAEHVAATEQLDVPISVKGSDEIARLAMAFNSMTTSLDAARQCQQQFIADASPQLRTR